MGYYGKLTGMHFLGRSFLMLFGALSIPEPLMAQLPFYTDDPAVAERGRWHFEFFNEFDALQRQYPNIRQNTVDFPDVFERNLVSTRLVSK